MKIILKRNKSKYKHTCTMCDLYQTYEYSDNGRKICDSCQFYEYFTIINKQDIEHTFVIQEEE